jgi:GR25 family glycosyltransferase involved in LPS biosynthesis
MKVFAIVIKDHPISEEGFRNLVASSLKVGNDFKIERFGASIPENVEVQMNEYKLKWNYPWEGSVLDPWTELRKTAYGGKDRLKRIACSLSHFRLWKMAIDENEPLLILEHDAEFLSKLSIEHLLSSKYGIIGINDPHMTTFAYQRYHDMIQSSQDDIQPVPMLASKEIPQGLAGNSAYLIKPEAAKHLVDLCYKYGLWPNDAIMCQQLCKFLGVTKTYYSRTQQLKSTTTF